MFAKIQKTTQLNIYIDNQVYKSIKVKNRRKNVQNYCGINWG